MVAMGFSIGIFVEMFTLPTGGLAFLLIFPLVYLLRASVASALLGFMFGKVIYLPLMFFSSPDGGARAASRHSRRLDRTIAGMAGPIPEVLFEAVRRRRDQRSHSCHHRLLSDPLDAAMGRPKP